VAVVADGARVQTDHLADPDHGVVPASVTAPLP